jgi:trehalose 2-sulfotransferase
MISLKGALAGQEGPPVYDLTTEAADYPEWQGPPERTLLICTHPRSGSTLLGETIYTAGGLGCPLEYFHRGFRPAFAERWQAPDLPSFVRAVHRFRTDCTGVLAVKLFWHDVEETICEHGQLDGQEIVDVTRSTAGLSDYLGIRAVLEGIFPNPTFVHLSRKDRVRKAVSALVAEQTQRYRSLPGAMPKAGSAVVTYNFERILQLMAFGDHCEANWQAFFAANRITPHELTYEDLISKGSGTLLQALGHAGPLVKPRLERQADARSESLVLRFLHEYCGGADVGSAAHDGLLEHALQFEVQVDSVPHGDGQ